MNRPKGVEKSRAEIFVSRLFRFRKTEAALFFAAAVLFYVLFCIFSAQENKSAYLLAVPFISLGCMAATFGLQYAFRRYDRLKTICTLVLGAHFLAAGIGFAIFFFIDIRQNFSLWLSPSFAGLCMLALCQGKS